MKVPRVKSRPSNDFQNDEAYVQLNDSTILEKVPMDEELWEDWQKVVMVDHKNSISPKRRISNAKKTPIQIPITVTSSSSVIIPKVLRRTRKLDIKIPRRKNKILRDFIYNDSSEPVVAKVTICRTIVPDEIRERRRWKKIEASTETQANESATDKLGKFAGDISMNLDATFADDTMCLTEDKLDSTLDTSQMPEETPLPHFYSLRDKVICVIEPDSGFSFQGKLRVQVLYGAVEIYGALLTREKTRAPVEVYSPRGSNLVCLRSVPGHSGNIASVWTALGLNDVDETICNDLQSKINSLTPGWTVLRLQNMENNLTSFLGKFCTHRLFPRIEDASNYTWSDPRRAEIVLQANLHRENERQQNIRFSKSQGILEEVSNTFGENKKLRILLAGGKNVGKSTTARYFVNNLLEKFGSVVFVDLDIGQAEFTPPGCISLTLLKSFLLGPNFTHQKTPFYQEFVGGVDASKHLGNYFGGVTRLAKFLDDWEEVEDLPVVVNTMGFCRGIGWDIMGHVIRNFNPTNVIQITSKKPKNNFEQLLTCEVMSRQNPIWRWTNSQSSKEAPLNYELYVMDTEAESKKSNVESWNIEPHQQREIGMLAYLSGILRTKSSKEGNEALTTINEVVPYQVPFSAVSVSLGRSQTSDALAVMNGSIVALCGLDSSHEKRELQEKVGYPNVLMGSPPAVSYGFGILRGIDMANEKLYINTPLSTSELKHVNCLIGSIPVPSGLLQLDSPGLPYAGDNCDLPTSRDSRRGYFRMRP